MSVGSTHHLEVVFVWKQNYILVDEYFFFCCTWIVNSADLHGLTQLQAKQELGALIAACRREHVFCACVMHGHGKHILKQQTPLWLAQHPHVMAFHQAPKEYGGDAALLVLIEVEEWLPPELP